MLIRQVLFGGRSSSEAAAAQVGEVRTAQGPNVNDVTRMCV